MNKTTGSGVSVAPWLGVLLVAAMLAFGAWRIGGVGGEQPNPRDAGPMATEEPALAPKGTEMRLDPATESSQDAKADTGQREALAVAEPDEPTPPPAAKKEKATFRFQLLDIDTRERLTEWMITPMEVVSSKSGGEDILEYGTAVRHTGSQVVRGEIESITGMRPGHFSMRIDVPGYGSQSIRAQLEPGDNEPRLLEFSNQGLISGTVLDNTGRPVEGAVVEAYGPRIRDFGDNIWAFWAGDWERENHLLAATRSNPEGKYSLKISGAGPVLLRAAPYLGSSEFPSTSIGGGSSELTHLNVTDYHALLDLEHAVGGVQTGVDLIMQKPALPTLVGQILIPEGQSYGDLRVLATMADKWGARMRVRPNDEGIFRATFLPQVPLKVSIGANKNQLLEQKIDPPQWGDDPVVFDLRDAWQRELQIQTVADGGAIHHTKLTLLDLKMQDAGEPGSRRSSVWLDPDGRADMHETPGQYLVLLEGQGWSWKSDVPITVEPGADLQKLEVAAPVMRREVQLINATTGEPYGKDRFMLVGEGGKQVQVDCYPDGKLMDSRTQGEVRIFAWSAYFTKKPSQEDLDNAITFPWPPPASLEVPPLPEK